MEQQQKQEAGVTVPPYTRYSLTVAAATLTYLPRSMMLQQQQLCEGSDFNSAQLLVRAMDEMEDDGEDEEEEDKAMQTLNNLHQ